MGTITGTDSADTLNGTSGDDTILGLGGNDTLNGGAGHDILTGGPGSDVLTGGVDADIYRDTAANFNGDEITKLKIGDRIQITDLDLSHGSIGLTGNIISYNNNGVSGSITVDNVGPGRLVLRLMNGGVELRLQQDAHNDFNGDGKSDILWRNDDGTVTDWLAQPGGGFANNSSTFQIQAGSSWHIDSTGDFNGDGRVDIMWRSDSGTVTDWLGQADGSFFNNYAKFSVQADPSWHIIGTGDFNADGNTDIMWRSDSGTVTDWLGQSDGSFFNNWANFTIQASTDWHIVGTGDFNGDGNSDIMWRSDSGKVTDWLGKSDGSFFNNYASFTMQADPSWHIVGTGDYNGDGLNDILWRSDSGTVTDWLGQPDGTFFNNYANFTIHADASWHIVGHGDFNGDSIDDLLWQSDSGQFSDWFGQPNGAIAPSAQGFYTSVDPHWHVQPQETLI